MKPEFAPLRVTIVDGLGVLLPGVAWLIVLVTALRIAATGVVTTPLKVGEALLDAAATKGLTFTVFLLLCGLAIGYGTKSLTNKPAEAITSWRGFRAIGQWITRKPPGEARAEEDYKSPYAFEHSAKPYFPRLVKLALEITGAERLVELRGLHAQPFSTCKRFLRLQSPPLWEEAEHAEAQTRMLGSLFIASVASALLSIGSGLRAQSWHDELTQGLALSLVFAALFGIAFRTRRRREVSIVYLNTLVALQCRKAEKGDA